MYKETRMSEVKITDGLIHKKRNIVEEKTIPYIRKALNNELYGVEPSGTKAGNQCHIKTFVGKITSISMVWCHRTVMCLSGWKPLL